MLGDTDTLRLSTPRTQHTRPIPLGKARSTGSLWDLEAADALSTMLDSMILPRWDPSELSFGLPVYDCSRRLGKARQYEKRYGIIVAEISLVDHMASNWFRLANIAEGSTLL